MGNCGIWHHLSEACHSLAEISNRMVPKSRHRDAPQKGEITLKRVKDTIPWWDNLRNLWRGDFTIIARNSEIVLDSSLKDTKSRHAFRFSKPPNARYLTNK